MLLVVTFLFTAVGLLLIGLAVPLIRRRVAPNRLYGLRVQATFANEWVWYEANARSGRDLVVLGIIQLCASLLPPLFIDLRAGSAAIVYLVANVAVGGIGAVAFAIIGWLRAERLLRKHRGDSTNCAPGGSL